MQAVGYSTKDCGRGAPSLRAMTHRGFNVRRLKQRQNVTTGPDRELSADFRSAGAD